MQAVPEALLHASRPSSGASPNARCWPRERERGRSRTATRYADGTSSRTLNVESRLHCPFQMLTASRRLSRAPWQAQLEHFSSSVVTLGGKSYELGGQSSGQVASSVGRAAPLPRCRHGAECTDHSQRHRGQFSHPLDLEAELAPIIGLGPVKTELLALQESLRIDLQRKREGKPVPPQKPLHMVFTGSPGSGKTMIGQLVGRLLHELGATHSGVFVEVQRTDLVGQVIGATALTTRGKVEEAKGGVLFVDEAYRLTSSGSHKDFGREALEELMRDMTSGGGRRERVGRVPAGRVPSSMTLRDTPSAPTRTAWWAARVGACCCSHVASRSRTTAHLHASPPPASRPRRSRRDRGRLLEGDACIPRG